MTDDAKKWITITVPYEESTRRLFDASGIDYDDGRLAIWVRRSEVDRRVRASDIQAAIERAWPAAESDRAKRLVEIEARHEAIGEDPGGTPAMDLGGGRQAHEDRGVLLDELRAAYTETAPPHAPWLLHEIREADTALTALGVPDDGRPLAERIRALHQRDLDELHAADKVVDAVRCLRAHEKSWGPAIEALRESGGGEAQVLTEARAALEHERENLGHDAEDEDPDAPLSLAWLGGTREATMAKLPADIRTQVKARAEEEPDPHAEFLRAVADHEEAARPPGHLLIDGALRASGPDEAAS